MEVEVQPVLEPDESCAAQGPRPAARAALAQQRAVLVMGVEEAEVLCGRNRRPLQTQPRANQATGQGLLASLPSSFLRLGEAPRSIKSLATASCAPRLA